MIQTQGDKDRGRYSQAYREKTFRVGKEGTMRRLDARGHQKTGDSTRCILETKKEGKREINLWGLFWGG